MQPQAEVRNRHWSCGFSDGDAVIHLGRNAHVVAVTTRVVPAGHVPVMYDDEGSCFVPVPADDLSSR